MPFERSEGFAFLHESLHVDFALSFYKNQPISKAIDVAIRKKGVHKPTFREFEHIHLYMSILRRKNSYNLNPNANQQDQQEKSPGADTLNFEQDEEQLARLRLKEKESKIDELMEISDQRYNSAIDFDRLMNTPKLDSEMTKFRLPADLRDIATTANKMARELQEEVEELNKTVEKERQEVGRLRLIFTGLRANHEGYGRLLNEVGPQV